MNQPTDTRPTDRRRPSGGRPSGGRPSGWLLVGEAPRAVGELALAQALRPWLAGAPRGDGHRVLVLPGLAASDRSTVPLRRYLRRLGYEVHGWGLGRNIPSRELIDRLRAQARELDEPVSLVGWSLGGIYAREIAKAVPDRVRQVITLGSPFRSWGDNAPLRVPSTAVFSRSDGIVPWRACVNQPGPNQETLEVLGSHCGLGHHPAVQWIVADRLALPADAWTPMEVPGPLRRAIRVRTEH